MDNENSVKLPGYPINVRKNGKSGRYQAYWSCEPKRKGSGKSVLAAIKSLVGKTVKLKAEEIERRLS